MLISCATLPTIAVTQTRAEHDRRQQRWRLAQHEGLSHKQENELQHALLTAWRRSHQQQTRVKVYAPEVVVQLQREEEERQREEEAARWEALSPNSRAKLSKAAGSAILLISHLLLSPLL